MLPKYPYKQIKEEDIHTVFSKTNKKVIYQNNKPELILTNETLGLQLCKRRDASVLKFSGKSQEISNKTLKKLIKSMKSVRTVHEVVVECQWYDLNS